MGFIDEIKAKAKADKKTNYSAGVYGYQNMGGS